MNANWLLNLMEMYIGKENKLNDAARTILYNEYELK
jgi:hypothetical protein